MRDPRVPLIRSRFSLGATPESDLDDLNYDTEVAAAESAPERLDDQGLGDIRRRHGHAIAQ